MRSSDKGGKSGGKGKISSEAANASKGCGKNKGDQQVHVGSDSEWGFGSKGSGKGKEDFDDNGAGKKGGSKGGKKGKGKSDVGGEGRGTLERPERSNRSEDA